MTKRVSDLRCLNCGELKLFHPGAGFGEYDTSVFVCDECGKTYLRAVAYAAQVRPYSPGLVRFAITQRAKRRWLPIDYQLQRAVVRAFHLPIPGNRGRVGYCTKAQRYAVTAYLTFTDGHSTSLTEGQGQALIEWLRNGEAAVLELAAILNYLEANKPIPYHVTVHSFRGGGHPSAQRGAAHTTVRAYRYRHRTAHRQITPVP